MIVVLAAPTAIGKVQELPLEAVWLYDYTGEPLICQPFFRLMV